MPGGIGYGGVKAAHDAGQRQWLPIVGDQQTAWLDFDRIAIEQKQRFVFHGMSHMNRAMQFLEIEGMHGLPQLEHDIIGDIDHGMNAADAAAFIPWSMSPIMSCSSWGNPCMPSISRNCMARFMCDMP